MAFASQSSAVHIVSSARKTHPVCSVSKPTLSSAATKILKPTVAVATLLAVTLLNPSDVDASLFHFRGERPNNIGLRSSRYLDSCPPTPNCISSFADVRSKAYVPSWTYQPENGPKKEMKEAIAELLDVVEQYPGATIIEKRATTSEVGNGYYIYAEFESNLMGFVDDVEFFFQPEPKYEVEYRSASRLGESDLDANRKRIRDIRKALMEKGGWASTGY